MCFIVPRGCHRCYRCTACSVTVPVVVPCGCCCHHLCTTCGVVVMVIVLHVVSQSWSLCHVWCHGCGCCTTWVSPSLSLCCVWFYGPGHCATWILQSQPLHCVGVTVMVIVPCGCHGCHHCAACGFVVVVAGPGRRGWLHVCWQGRW